MMGTLPRAQGMCDDAVTVEQFCRRYVEPMGEESDHVHIVALTDALQVLSRDRATRQPWQQPAS